MHRVRDGPLSGPRGHTDNYGTDSYMVECVGKPLQSDPVLSVPSIIAVSGSRSASRVSVSWSHPMFSWILHSVGSSTECSEILRGVRVLTTNPVRKSLYVYLEP